jgi:hypothetical protein
MFQWDWISGFYYAAKYYDLAPIKRTQGFKKGVEKDQMSSIISA